MGVIKDRGIGAPACLFVKFLEVNILITAKCNVAELKLALLRPVHQRIDGCGHHNQ